MAINRLLQIVMSCLMLLAMGLADLPRPCIGDGKGNPCSIESCACVMACTCKAHCGPDVSASEVSPSLPSTDAHAACHMGQAAAQEGGASDFSLPEQRSPIVLPPRPAYRLAPVEPAPYRHPDVVRFASRYLPPDEPPPRITG